MSIEADRITEYLRTRPIAPILEQSDEKENLIALKFMYILDYETERNQSKLNEFLMIKYNILKTININK